MAFEQPAGCGTLKFFQEGAPGDNKTSEILPAFHPTGISN